MKNHTRNSQNSGFTLVEMLATVGIIVILLGLAMVGVVRYVDALKIAELDNAARAIYMAAENRAVLLSNSQRLDDKAKEKGTPTKLTGVPVDADAEQQHNADEKLYYVPAAGLGDDLLTYGAIDPTLLSNGDFYIVYKLYTYDDDKDEFTGSGSVTDVFYVEKPNSLDDLLVSTPTPLSGTPEINLDGLPANDGFAAFYSHWAVSRSTRLEQKNETGKKVLVGWYNGTAEGGGVREPGQPDIKVIIDNGEELTVTVTVTWDESIDTAVRAALGNFNEDQEGSLKVMLGGIDLMNTTGRNRGGFDPIHYAFENEYAYSRTWVLDSLADPSLKFLALGSDITPGDNFTVTATISPGSNNGFKANTKTSEEDNSLFQAGSGKGNKIAYIYYLRHLQNLDAENVYTSGVNGNENIISAEQTSNISGNGNQNDENEKPIYLGYNFVPISNNSLTSYDGWNREIRDLNVNYSGYQLRVVGVDDDNTIVMRVVPVENDSEEGETAWTDNAGLFRETRAGAMTLKRIRLVNTMVEATESAGAEIFVGTLAGQTYGTTTIDNCWVYWDDVSKLAKGPVTGGNVIDTTDKKYQIVGPTTGGLVGQVNGTTTIKESLTATLVEGKAAAGGLVGDVSGALNIEKSYADCYLTATEQAAGLVGNAASGTVKLENCYAAGFIMGGRSTAGLCFGSVTDTTKNVYSVMLYRDPNGNYKAPPSLTGNPDKQTFGAGANVYYLGSGGIEGAKGRSSVEMSRETNTFANTMGSGNFDWKTKEKANTHPYNLQDFDPKLEVYDYPGLKDLLPHYGDWGTLSTNPLQLVYYEGYGTGTTVNSWGGSGIGISALENNKTILIDGYAVAIEQNELPQNVTNVTVTFNESARVTVDCSSFTRTTETKNDSGWQQTKTESRTSKNDVLIPTNWGGKDYYMIPLPDDLVLSKDSAPEGFYEHLSIEAEVSGGNAGSATQFEKNEFYFNPHFANTVQSGDSDSAPNKPSEIEIRTARHLWDLSQHKEYYHNSSKYMFSQKLNLSYITYTGYDGLFVGSDGKLTDIQRPIGGAVYESGAVVVDTNGNPVDGNSFNGTYNGNSKTIDYLVINSAKIAGNGYQGLFGYNTGTILNVVLTEHCSVSGTAHIGGIVGYNKGGILEGTNTNYGNVEGGYCVGGIVGTNDGGSLEGTKTNYGKVTSCDYITDDGLQYGERIGGLVGFNTGGGTLKGTNHNLGTFEESGHSTYVGGIVGLNEDGILEGTSKNESHIEVKFIQVTRTDTWYENVEMGEGDYIWNGNQYEYVGAEKGNIKKIEVKYSDIQGGFGVGGVVGVNWSTVKGTVENSGTINGVNAVGGIVGVNSGSMGESDGTTPNTNTNTNTGKIFGMQDVGGIVGENSGGTVDGTNKNRGEVQGTEDDLIKNLKNDVAYRIGGIVGLNVNEGTLTGTNINENDVAGINSVGGIAGSNLQSNMDGTNTNTGNVSGDVAVGGVVGDNNEGTVAGTNKNSGEVTGLNIVGGIVGQNQLGGHVSNGFNVGNVTGGKYNDTTGAYISDGDFVGGVVGQSRISTMYGYNSEVTNCYNGYEFTGDGADPRPVDGVQIKGHNYVGGIVGSNEDMVDGTMNNGSVTGVNCIGGIVGENGEQGAVYSCTNNVSIVTEAANVGGIVGNNKGTLGNAERKNENKGDITGLNMVGGIAGQNVSATIDGEFNVSTGDVTGTGGWTFVGGYVGYNIGSGVVQNCTFDQKQTVTGYGRYAGGIVGLNHGAGAEIINCKNYGTVTQPEGTSIGSYFGGIAGANSYGTVQNCYNNGRINGYQQVGGIVGSNDEFTVTAADYEKSTGGTVDGCVNDADITCCYYYDSDVNLGGIAGVNSMGSTVSRCYNTGDIINYGNGHCVGGVVGNNSGDSTVKYCYNTGIVYSNCGRYDEKTMKNISEYIGGVVGCNQANYNDIVGQYRYPSYIIGCYSYVDMSRFNIDEYKNKFDNTQGTFKDWVQTAAVYGGGGNYDDSAGTRRTVQSCYSSYFLKGAYSWAEFPDAIPVGTADFQSTENSGINVLDALEAAVDSGDYAKFNTDKVWRMKSDNSRPVLIGVGTEGEGVGTTTVSNSEEHGQAAAIATSGPEIAAPAESEEVAETTHQAAPDPTASETNDMTVLDPNPVESEPKDLGQPDMEVPEPEEPGEQKEVPVPEQEQTAALPPKPRDPDDLDADEPDPGPEPGYGPDPEPEDGPEL